MTGGLAFVFDLENNFLQKLNGELVRAEKITNDEDDARLRDLIRQYAEATESVWASGILSQWKERREEFWKIVPK